MADKISVTHNLPRQATSFIGRLEEIAHINALLDSSTCQLLTLVGSGGIGKTRLALQIAQQKLAAFPHGVWFVPLAPLSSPDQIPAAIAKALQIQISGQFSPNHELLNFLSGKQLLLLLDNFEHLLPGANFVEDILITAPAVKILVTSRAALNLQAEWVQIIHGMSYPESELSRDLEAYSAVQLFAERARHAQSDFSLVRDGDCAVRICRLVEGMPLAIELAAAWLKSIPCDIIAEHIQHDLGFLTSSQQDIPERHRSIRAVFDHSWKLLTRDEQQVFQRFSVFRGGCTLDAAEQITGASLAMIASLVEKSLLRLEPSGRYGLHEMLRQYGEEKLIASGEFDSAHNAHSVYYCHFMGLHESDTRGHRQLEAVQEIEPDFENVRAAWLWALEHRDYGAIDRSLETLDRFCHMRTRFEDSRVLFEKAWEQLAPQGDEPPHRVWGRVLARPNINQDLEQQCERRRQALSIARLYDDPIEIATCLYWMGEATNMLHDHQQCVSYLEESLALFRAHGERFYTPRVLNELAICHYMMGKPEKAISYGQEALSLRHEIGDRIGVAWCTQDLGVAHFLLGNLDESDHYMKDALRLFNEIGSLFGVRTVYFWRIWKSCLMGDLDEAQTIVEAWFSASREYDYPTPLLTMRGFLSWMAALRGDSQGCRTLAAFIDNAKRSNIEVFDAHLALAIVANDRAEARQHFHEMLHGPPLGYVILPIYKLHCLPIAALVAADDGDPNQAVEILALIDNQPPHLIGWIKHWSRIAGLHDELEAKLGAAACAAAWERGQKLDLDETIAGLRRKFLIDIDEQQRSNQILDEPLTPRELEVLNLIFAGHSNREIAEHFVLAESTIKRHINHIYDKLGVTSRTQALARARELGLIH